MQNRKLKTIEASHLVKIDFNDFRIIFFERLEDFCQGQTTQSQPSSFCQQRCRRKKVGDDLLNMFSRRNRHPTKLSKSFLIHLFFFFFIFPGDTVFSRSCCDNRRRKPKPFLHSPPEGVLLRPWRQLCHVVAF